MAPDATVQKNYFCNQIFTKNIVNINVYVYIRNQCFFMIPDTDITPAESKIRATESSYIHLGRSRTKATFWDLFVIRMRNLEHSAAVF